ncbi:MAG: hypothetical protein VB098_01840 [Petrimonas sp.]|nr:hypothetical protein [Petrimonas sp.]
MFGIKVKRRIEQLEGEIRLLKAENAAMIKAADESSETYQYEINRLRASRERYRELYKEYHEKVNNLTRKRDAKGRFVKA